MAGGTEGQIVDVRFELLNRLGSGGMGTVWRARDTALHREVALKEVRPTDPALTPENSEASRLLRERVLREARALAMLSHHPHVVTVHHIADEGPFPWIVMELIPGASLQQRLEQAVVEPSEAARIGVQMVSALRTAHAAGIHHRDIKPANVLLRHGDSVDVSAPAEQTQAVLTDFGIAALQGSSQLTATGEFLGSPEFIAPERIRSAEDDPASDLWSLGMTLYVCAEGYSPLRRGTTLATLAAVLDEPLPPPVRSGRLAPVLNALLVRDTASRPDSQQLATMLQEVADGRDATPFLPTQGGQLPRAPLTPTSAPPPAPAQHGASTAAPPPGSSTPPPDAPPGDTTKPGGNGGSGGGRRRRTPALVGAALAGVLLLAGAGAGATMLMDGDDSAGGSEPTGPPTTPEKSPPDDGSSKPAPDPTDSGGPADPDESPTSKPPPADGPGDTWVAQLASVSKSEGAASRGKQQAQLDKKVDGARWVDSDEHASLRPGYWFFYSPGPNGGGGFDSGSEAADWCRDQGLTATNQCLGRYLSDDPSDRKYLCAADRSGGSGRCERD